MDSTTLECSLCVERARREEERLYKETVKLTLDPDRQVRICVFNMLLLNSPGQGQGQGKDEDRETGKVERLW